MKEFGKDKSLNKDKTVNAPLGGAKQHDTNRPMGGGSSINQKPLGGGGTATNTNRNLGTDKDTRRDK